MVDVVGLHLTCSVASRQFQWAVWVGPSFGVEKQEFSLAESLTATVNLIMVCFLERLATACFGDRNW
jgi:hypothetical protein